MKGKGGGRRTPGDRSAARGSDSSRGSGVTTPPRRRGNQTPSTAEVAAPSTGLARSHAHATGRRLPAHARRPGPASLPKHSEARRPPASTSPGPRAHSARSPPRPSPSYSGDPFHRTRPPGRARLRPTAPHAGGSSHRTAHLARGELLPRSRPAEPGWGLRGSAGRRTAGNGGRRGGGGGQDSGSHLLSPPPAAPAASPGVLAHSPGSSQPCGPSASPSPHSHTLSLPNTHTRPLLVPSLACRARATPLTHSARDAGGDRPAPPDRAPPARSPRTGARPGPALLARRRGGGGGGGRLEELGARPACRAPPSGSDTCVGTRPRSASPAPEPSLALEETRWIPRGERKGSARALRGRAFPPAPKPSTLRKRNGWGCEAGLGGSSL
ncbi:uncharacterized protein LOC103795176 [Callithrix jacchus]